MFGNSRTVPEFPNNRCSGIPERSGIPVFSEVFLSPTLGNITNILRPRPGNYHLASPLRPTDYHRRLLSDPRVITGDFCPTHGIALLIPLKKVISPGGSVNHRLEPHITFLCIFPTFGIFCIKNLASSF